METSRSTQRDRIFRFGPFELSEAEGELRKNGVRVKLQEQPFRVLAELVANAGKIVTREELQQKLWPADTFVDFDVGLNSVIRKLRQALNDDADSPRYIETLAKRGYRFVAPVAETAAVPTGQDPPAQIPASLSTDGTSSTTNNEIQRKPRRWYWVLAAACALAFLIYGAVEVWRRTHTTQPLATEQQITANPPEAPVTAAVVSPDGKYVAYSDTTGVYIRHIDTGEVRPLQLPEGFDAVPTGWFPDGTHLLLSSGEVVFGAGRLSQEEIPSLWKVSVLGGSPQKLVDNASGGAISPDGSKIAFLRGDTGAAVEIWVMGNDGSNLHRIVEAAGPKVSVLAGKGPPAQVFLSGVTWSPDGTRIAYVRRFEPLSMGLQENERSLETVGVNGGTPRVLKVSAQLLTVVCWTPDGRLLFGFRDRLSTERFDYGIWSIRVNQTSGMPEGKEAQVTKGAGEIGGLSVTAAGNRLVLWRDNLYPTVFLTEIDPQSGRLRRLRRLTLDENSNIVTAWTPDSHAVLFVSNRNGTYKLFRQAIDKAVPEVLVEGRGIFGCRLSPSGTEILYLTGYNPEDPAQPVSVVAVAIAGGPPRVVLQMPYIGDIECARSPAKLCLLGSPGYPESAGIFSFDPDDGKAQPFSALQGFVFDNWSLSPDGSHVALASFGPQRKISFVDVRDKSSREVNLKGSPRLQGMDWTADGTALFVTRWAANGAAEVLGVDPRGNLRVLLEGDKGSWYWWVIPSPDGRYGALQAMAGENNVWMVENF